MVHLLHIRQHRSKMIDNKIRQTVYKLRNDPQKLYELLDTWEQKIKKAKQQILRLIQKKGNQEKTEQSKITNKNAVPIQERVTINVKRETND